MAAAIRILLLFILVQLVIRIDAGKKGEYRGVHRMICSLIFVFDCSQRMWCTESKGMVRIASDRSGVSEEAGGVCDYPSYGGTDVQQEARVCRSAGEHSGVSHEIP